MKILITGGAGFIGSNLIHLLIAETDHEVVNLDKLTYAGNPDSLASVRDDPRYEFAECDLCDAEAVHDLVMRTRPDAIMHLAAESHVDRSIDGPGAFMDTNIMGTYNLLQAARDFWQSLPAGEGDRFRFLHVSTDEVFGSLSMDAPAFSETTPYDPHSPYSASKAASDHLVRAWKTTYGLPVLLTNCSNNYGPRQFPEKLVPTVILRCLRQQPIPVYGKGENIRDWLYVDDHCRALLTVLTQGASGASYNIGGDCEMTNLELIHKLVTVVSELVPALSSLKAEDLIEFVRDRPGHDLRYAMDSSKIQRELGWRAAESFETGIRKTVQWYLDNEAWIQRIEDGNYRGERLGLG